MSSIKAQLLAITSLLALTTGASPVAIQARADPCVPTSYTINNYVYEFKSNSWPEAFTNPYWAKASVSFQATFSDPSIINDPASAGATCAVESSTGTIAPGNACSTGQDNLAFGYGTSQFNSDLVFTHNWVCGGVDYSSNTWYRVNAVSGSAQPGPNGGYEGKQTGFQTESFAPGNVTHV